MFYKLFGGKELDDALTSKLARGHSRASGSSPSGASSRDMSLRRADGTLYEGNIEAPRYLEGEARTSAKKHTATVKDQNERRLKELQAELEALVYESSIKYPEQK